MTFLNKEMVDLYHLNFLNDEIWREIYILSYHGLMSGGVLKNILFLHYSLFYGLFITHLWVYEELITVLTTDRIKVRASLVPAAALIPAH